MTLLETKTKGTKDLQVEFSQDHSIKNINSNNVTANLTAFMHFILTKSIYFSVMKINGICLQSYYESLTQQRLWWIHIYAVKFTMTKLNVNIEHVWNMSNVLNTEKSLKTFQQKWKSPDHKVEL